MRSRARGCRLGRLGRWQIRRSKIKVLVPVRYQVLPSHRMPVSQLLSQEHLQPPTVRSPGVSMEPLWGQCYSPCWTESPAQRYLGSRPGSRAGNHSKNMAGGTCRLILIKHRLGWHVQSLVAGNRQKPAGRPTPQGSPSICWATGSCVRPGRTVRLRAGPCTPQVPPVPLYCALNFLPHQLGQSRTPHSQGLADTIPPPRSLFRWPFASTSTGPSFCVSLLC